MQAWKVHKFGGSSVADAACMERVAQIIEADPVSALAAINAPTADIEQMLGEIDERYA